MASTTLTRDAMLRFAQAPIAVREVEVPGLGSVRVRPQRAGDRERIESQVRKELDRNMGTSGRARALRVAAVVVSEGGSLMFDAANPDDLAALANMPWMALDRIIEAGETFEPAPEVAEPDAVAAV